MATRMVIDELIRLTLTQKGKATAKHPLLREGVVEVVKARPTAPANATPKVINAAEEANNPAFVAAYNRCMYGESVPGVTHKATPVSPYPNLDRYRKQYQ